MMWLYDWFVKFFIGRIEWSSLKFFLTGQYYGLKSDDIRKAVAMMSTGRYIILIRRETHLTTYLIGLGHLLKTFFWPMQRYPAKFGFWSHAAMHIESESLRDIDLQILEAIGKGVVSSDWWDVLNVDAICLLKPKHLDEDEFDKAMEAAKTLIGKGYDTIFDLKDSEKVSCVEFAYWSMLQADGGCLPNLSLWVERTGNLTPQMMYDSGDFEIAFEVRR